MAERSLPVPFRGGGFEPRRIRHAALVSFCLLLVVWQASASLGWVSQLTLPGPLRILDALWAMTASGELFRHLGASLYRLIIGWSLGAVAGLALGLAIGMSSLARSVGIPMVSALFPIPKIAMLPLFILWFGIGEPSKVATIALGTFFPTAINAYAGVDAVPRSLVRMAQSFGLSTTAIVRTVILPGALPGMLAGIRISSSIALVLLVAAEMIGAEHGVGAMVLQAGNLMRTDRLMAGVVLLSVLGLLVSAVISRLELRLLRWR
ncbi:ABC transporter permease [Geminicoccaceae bacterium 1502E]|nr:ABC transporter permease [Geminicoccaceae bacterium 1502E]